MTINIDELRNDLLNYYGSATPNFPQAFMEYIEIQNASDNKLIEIAFKSGFDLNNYNDTKRR